MKAYSFKYNDVATLESRLKEIRSECSGCAMSFALTWRDRKADQIMQVSDTIQRFFPDAVCYGAETDGSISEGRLEEGFWVTATAFEQPDARLEMLWVKQGTELSSMQDLWDVCKTKPGLRAIELIPSISYLDTLKMDNNDVDLDMDIVVFGGASTNFLRDDYHASIFAKGHGVTGDGLAAILYYGDDLHFSFSYFLGWKGIGRYMTVTKSEGKHLMEIDGKPAFSIYEKYLNITKDDTSSLVFPLIVNEDDNVYLRTPQDFLDDDTLDMIIGIDEGSKVRLAYGDKNTILNSIANRCERISEFQPEQIKIFSCTGRLMFWGEDEVSKETAPIQEIAPSHGFYTGGEILRFKSKLRVLNSTLVAVGLREGPAASTHEKRTFEIREDKSVVARLAYFSGIIAKEQETQYAHEKLRADISEYLSSHQGSPMEMIQRFAGPLRELLDCDQVIYTDHMQSRYISNSSTAESVWAEPFDYCRQCEYFNVHSPVYVDGFADVSNCRAAGNGVNIHPDCPVKSKLGRLIYVNDEPVGILSVHFIDSFHEFTQMERETLSEFARLMSMGMTRYFVEQENELLRQKEEQRRRDKEAGLTTALENLFEKYDFILFINPTQDESTILRSNKTLEKIYHSLDPSLGRRERLLAFFQSIVVPEDYEAFEQNVSGDFKNQIFDMNKTYQFETRFLIDGKISYYRVKFSGVERVEGAYVIGLQNINDDVLLKQKLESEHMGRLLLESFEAVYRVDMVNDTYVTLKSTEDGVIPHGHRTVWSKASTRFARYCTEETRGFADDVSDLTRLRAILKANHRKEYLYRHDEKDQWHRAVVETFAEENGEPTMALVTLTALDEAASQKEDIARRVEIIAAERTKELKKANETLSVISDSMLEVMSDVIESRNAESGQHVRRVRGFTDILARQLMKDFPRFGLTDDKVKVITHASALHDIGKIGIPDSVLLKPGRLTPEEFEIMKTHSQKGADIIDKLKDIWDSDYIDTARDICLYHHEKVDGRGYPFGRKGEEIPISAQIVSLCDAYDALTSERCYKAAYTYPEAFRMIMDGECGQFSQELLFCFNQCESEFERYAQNPTELPAEKKHQLADDTKYRMPSNIKKHEFILDKMPLIKEIAESVPNGFFVCYKQEDGPVLFFNKLLSDMMGMESREEFVLYTGNTFRGIIHPDDYRKTMETLGNQVENNPNEQNHVVFRANRKDGLERIFELYGHVIHSDDLGDVFFASVFDVSDYRIASQKKQNHRVFNDMKILLVDDDEFSRGITKSILESDGATVYEAVNGREAVKTAQEIQSLDLILMDIVMPIMSGTEAIGSIREDARNARIPIIALTAVRNPMIRQECLNAGADDLVQKPLSVPELSKKLFAIMKRNSEWMDEQLRNAVKTSNTDMLTHVKNITAYTAQVLELEDLIRQDNGATFAVVVCDVNHLKDINENYGHAGGDQYIKNCCKIICTIFSKSPVFRIGGDEFAVILQGDDYKNRDKRMRRLDSQVEQAARIPSLEEGHASLASGLAEYVPGSGQTVADVIKLANESMLRNKKKMRN